MASANDLIVLFIGLEVLSVAAYVLAAMHSRRLSSQEAGMKYFVLGAFSSAFLLYGIALTYGATGSTNLAKIQAFLSDDVIIHNGLLLAGLALHAGRARASRSRPPRSTSGRPTCTRARRHRWSPSWRRWSRRPGSPGCCGCSS